MQVQEEGVDADATPAISRQQTSSDQGTRIIVSLGTLVHFYFYAKAQLVRMFTNTYRKATEILRRKLARGAEHVQPNTRRAADAC